MSSILAMNLMYKWIDMPCLDMGTLGYTANARRIPVAGCHMDIH